VDALFALLTGYLADEADRLRTHGIRLTVIGRRDRLPARLAAAIETAEAATAAGRDMHLRVAVDYSSREAIARALALMPRHSDRPHEELTRILGSPDVDLLIRTGGEQRLSDFLLWEAAYAELMFLKVAWPEFTGDDLVEALLEFSRRQRRFGSIAQAV
jgi:undecaprenyl diphosphate synthase